MSGEVKDMFGLRESRCFLKWVDSLGKALEVGREGSKLWGKAQHGCCVSCMGLSTW